jgi:1,2-phenylacetyl-CoA epoxidase PaaB subunit
VARKGFRWNVYRLRGTPAQFIGTVEAPDEATAIEKAIEEFHITDPAMQKRLIAQRTK